MTSRTIIILGSLAGMTAVILGASGAHGLKPALTAAGMYEVFHLGVQYQFYHALALLATGAFMRQQPAGLLKYAAACFFIGILFFSGSLYLMSLTSIKGLGPVTPAGGVLFIAGWALLLVAFLKKK